MKGKSQLSPALLNMLKPNQAGAGIKSDRDEQLSQYEKHSSISRPTQKRLYTRFEDNDDVIVRHERSKTGRQKILKSFKNGGKIMDPVTEEQEKIGQGPIISTYKRDYYKQLARSQDNVSNYFIKGKREPYLTTCDEYTPSEKKSVPDQRVILDKRHEITDDVLENKLNQYQNVQSRLQHKKTGSGRLQSNEKSKRDPSNEADRQVQTNPNQFENTENEDQTSILDYLSQADIQSIIPIEILQDKNVNLEKLIEDNTDYFYDVIGRCIQKKQYKQSIASSYAIHFPKKQIAKIIPKLTNNSYATKFLDQKQIDYTSTQNLDYRDPCGTKPEIKRRIYEKIHKPFNSMTSYTGNFVDWKDYDTYICKSPQHISTYQELPFFSKTSYQQAFGDKNKNGSSCPVINNQAYPCPYPGGVSFRDETTNSHTFRKYNKGENLNTQNTKNNVNLQSKFECCPSYIGQFRTTQGRDFNKRSRFGEHEATDLKLGKIKLLKKLEELRKMYDYAV